MAVVADQSSRPPKNEPLPDTKPPIQPTSTHQQPPHTAVDWWRLVLLTVGLYILCASDEVAHKSFPSMATKVKISKKKDWNDWTDIEYFENSLIGDVLSLLPFGFREVLTNSIPIGFSIFLFPFLLIYAYPNIFERWIPKNKWIKVLSKVSWFAFSTFIFYSLGLAGGVGVKSFLYHNLPKFSSPVKIVFEDVSIEMFLQFKDVEELRKMMFIGIGRVLFFILYACGCFIFGILAKNPAFDMIGETILYMASYLGAELFAVETFEASVIFVLCVVILVSKDVCFQRIGIGYGRT